MCRYLHVPIPPYRRSTGRRLLGPPRHCRPGRRTSRPTGSRSTRGPDWAPPLRPARRRRRPAFGPILYAAVSAQPRPTDVRRIRNSSVRRPGVGRPSWPSGPGRLGNLTAPLPAPCMLVYSRATPRRRHTSAAPAADRSARSRPAAPSVCFPGPTGFRVAGISDWAPPASRFLYRQRTPPRRGRTATTRQRGVRPAPTSLENRPSPVGAGRQPPACLLPRQALNDAAPAATAS